MTLPDLKQLEAIVKPAAADILLPGFGKQDYSYKADGSIITAADEAMQQRLQDELQTAWPDYAFLGEEMSEAEQRAAMSNPAGYWCIDPLDGTNNYATGMPFFAVSIALIVNSEQTLGLVYDPLRDEVFTAIKGEGALLNGEPLKCIPNKTEIKRAIAEIDMKRLPKELAVRLVNETPFSSQRNIGSSALDWCWLSACRYNIYLHGGQKPWDYAAGNLILHEAGGQSTALDGEPVFRGKYEDRSVLASLDQSLFSYWKQWVGIPVGKRGTLPIFFK
jgi:myo-inositol-1(or 4)-monophosphatase